MTGLERIVKDIEDEALAKAAKINEEVQTLAKKIIAEAQVQGEEKCAEIEEHTKLEVQSLLKKGESSARLQEKKLILNAKQTIITEVLNRAKTTLVELPEAEYFENILKLVSKYALVQAGSLLFSSSDLKRLPEGFEESIREVLKEKAGATLTILTETRNIDGGFVLIYGDIEINCSFEALFLSAKEDLQDKVCQILFA